jgi:hypothetical protein
MNKLIQNKGNQFIEDNLVETPKEISIRSNIGKSKLLQLLAIQATENETVQRDMDRLVKQLSIGHLQGGIGKKCITGKNINYLRSYGGARLYFRRIGTNSYEIIGKSSKGTNQNQVINALIRMY